MRRPRHAPIGLALAGALAFVAACGPSATATPTPGAPASVPPTAPPATIASTPTAPAPTLPVPSFIGDKELEAMFPAEIGGEPVTVRSMNGSEIPPASAQQVTLVLEALKKQPADLSVAFAGTSTVTIQGFRVKGVPAAQILSTLLTVYVKETPGSTSSASFDGKAVTKFVPISGVDATVYLYTAGDTVFTVGGGPTVSEALLTEVFSKLP